MKRKITKIGIVTIGLFFQAYFAKGQFNQTIISGQYIGRTNGTPTNISAIGIGNFTVVPSARLHVNNFLCNLPNGSLSGFLFPQ